MRYRAEIDGLRALAVTAVMFFHAGFRPFEGGFVGVDVFFVISGYLITSILLDDFENDGFSIARFYERRARRILPALFFVLLCCIPLSLLWMQPHEFDDFSRGLVSVVLFSSNILFWTQSGYFSSLTDENPLLHTWSLAVEEQYYIVFPLLLILTWPLGRRWVFWTIAVLAASSLVLSEWAWRQDAAASFYLMPTRAWELLAGSLAAYAVRRYGVRNSDLLSLAGLAAIVVSVLTYDDKTPFPGLYALAPVLGSVLIVVFGGRGTLVARFLSTRPMVTMGLISYSAYLWHQPLFAFARIRSMDEPGTALMVALIATTLVLATATWYFVERPFRNMSAVPRRVALRAATAGALALAAVGILGHGTAGFENLMRKYKYDADYFRKYKIVQASIGNRNGLAMTTGTCRMSVRDTRYLDRRKLEDCRERYGKATVILGDSHAGNVYNILANSKDAKFLIGVSRGGCRPYDRDPKCQYRSFEKFLRNEGSMISKVIFHQSGSHLVLDSRGREDNQKAFEGKFRKFSARNIDRIMSYLSGLARNHDVGVVWLGPFLEYRFDPDDIVVSADREFVNPNSVTIFRNLEKFLKKKIGAETSFSYVKFADIFPQPRSAIVGDCLIYRDKDHYSNCGERFLSREGNIPRLLGNASGVYMATNRP
ncbi:MAG: acyltransferase [Geminicoccaceae bacterium]|nr:acyltransferase [Geminicoccaceae bacterium]MCB9945587.1 acyltransferase [Geminicoccaceae bacterium]